jgi:hypothetical protein
MRIPVFLRTQEPRVEVATSVTLGSCVRRSSDRITIKDLL